MGEHLQSSPQSTPIVTPVSWVHSASGLQIVASGGMILLAFALRLYRLDFQSLWYDEGWSVYLARRPFWEALPLIAGSGHTHPPGYYLLLSTWSALAGTTEFAVRFLSAALGMLLVVAGAYLARRLFDRAAALLGLAALAVAPVLVVYAQETRMYTLLALEYVVLLVLFHRLLAAPLGDRRPWAALVVAEVAAVYTHYFAAVLIGYLSAAFVLVMLVRSRQTVVDARSRPARAIGAWLAVQLGVAVAYLPWAAVAIRQTGEHVPRDVAPPALAAFVLDTWHFFNAGVLAAASNSEAFAVLSLLAGALGVAAVSMAVVVSSRAAGTQPIAALHPSPAGGFAVGAGPGMQAYASNLLFLTGHGLVPLLGVYVVSHLRPGVHPRYVMMLAVPLFLAVAAGVRILLARRPGPAIVAGATGVVFGAAWLAGLWIATFDSSTFRDDVRAVAAAIARESTAADLVVFDYEDWAYHYYDRGPAATAYLPLSGDDQADAERLAGRLTGRGDVFLVDWHQGRTDFRNLMPFLLETAGRLIDRDDLPGLSVRRYRLNQPDPAAAIQDLQFAIRSLSPHGVSGDPQSAIPLADFGTVQLTEAYLPETVPADGAVPVALRWRLAGPAEQHLKAALSLRDAAGRELSRADLFLLDTRGLDTARWPAGAEVTTYAVLPVPPGTPPLTYAVDAGVYDEADVTGLDVRDAAGNPAGKRAVLGRVQLAPAATQSLDEVEGEPRDPYRAAPELPPLGNVRLADGLVLEAGGASRAKVGPGEAVDVTLRWQAERADLADLTPSLRLTQAGRVLAEQTAAPADGQYPTSRWQAGETVVDRRRLRVPADAPPGQAELSVVMGDGPAVPVARLEVESSSRSFVEPPVAVRVDRAFPGVAELVGYDLEPEPGTGCELEAIGWEPDTGGTPGVQPPASGVRLPTSRLQVPASDFQHCVLNLTLHWRSAAGAGRESLYPGTLPASDGAGSRPLAVFTHLLDAGGRLIAQHDGPPAGDRRPTTGWVENEFIADPHPMRFRSDLTPEQLRAVAEAGPARVEIGLYDPSTGERVPAEGGVDHIVLPARIELELGP